MVSWSSSLLGLYMVALLSNLNLMNLLLLLVLLILLELRWFCNESRSFLGQPLARLLDMTPNVCNGGISLVISRYGCHPMAQCIPSESVGDPAAVVAYQRQPVEPFGHATVSFSEYEQSRSMQQDK